jgi:NAD(P)H-flavin reductase
MQEIQAIIERVRRVSPSLQRLDVVLNRAQANMDIAPGQLFLARTAVSLDPFLREPWTPVERNGTVITVELPVSNVYEPEQFVSLLGPIGKSIPLRDNVRSLLLIAIDSTPAALLLLAQTMLKRVGGITLVLVGAATQYPLELLPKELEVARAESWAQWSTKDQALKWADQIVAVAPPPFDLEHYQRLMEDVRRVRMNVPENYLFGLFQPPMPCGVGACAACLIRCGGEDVAACLEGPSFDLTSIIKLQG